MKPEGQSRGEYVVYWMQQSQRVERNHALCHAITLSTEQKLPLVVVFLLNADVPSANTRHYQFMLEGMHETAQTLARQGIAAYVCSAGPGQVFEGWLARTAVLVCDKGYLRWQREWHDSLKGLRYRVDEVESDVVVPVGIASDKEEYSAATLRRKLLKQLPDYLAPARQCKYMDTLPKVRLSRPDFPILTYEAATSAAQLEGFAYDAIRPDKSVPDSQAFKGGYGQASRRLDEFIQHKLIHYSMGRGDPALDLESGLSPYLHFGQISSVEISQRVLDQAGIMPLELPQLIMDKTDADPLRASAAAFLEELIVRRELSCNFCFYNKEYDSLAGLPNWARQSLNNHILDPRPREYSLDRLESAVTDDPYWNAAQIQMLRTGKMHNYMRMYWGKKLIEWSPDPETAFAVAVYLNDKYELDGRDPNSYAGIAWCFGKHDRPWAEREVFGTVRYMNMNGLKRKFKMQAYTDQWLG
jgi:deoxyribodipyrimidine photo-lyase